jgi:hypothetical protein
MNLLALSSWRYRLGWQSMASVFRNSARIVPWTKKELGTIAKMWTKASMKTWTVLFRADYSPMRLGQTY